MSPKVSDEYLQDVRERILSAAENLFSQKGYYETSMDDVVKESEMSKGAIYGHFSSKKELFLAVRERRFGFLAARIKSLYSAKESPTNKLTTLIEFAFESRKEISKDTCRMILEFWAQAPRIDTLQSIMNREHDAFQGLLAEILEEGVRKKEFRRSIDCNTLASVLLAAYDGLTIYSAITTSELDWTRMKDEFLQLVLLGVLK
jgi:AcrR family transcriptional regulator